LRTRQLYVLSRPAICCCDENITSEKQEAFHPLSDRPPLLQDLFVFHCGLKCILVEEAQQETEDSIDPTVESQINQSHSPMEARGGKARQLNSNRRSFSETDLLYEIDKALVLARDFLYSKGKSLCVCCLLVRFLYYYYYSLD
jgi:hypothetical protein